MRSGGNNLNVIFLRIDWPNSAQFKRVFMFCTRDWGKGLDLLGPRVYATEPWWRRGVRRNEQRRPRR